MDNLEGASKMEPSRPSIFVGSDIFGLITAGMYGNPLAMYREYIQNSADALASSSFLDTNRIDVLVDPVQMEVKIRDNGPGLSPKGAIQNLIPIGNSRKEVGRNRGFRGIGRLAGLAFAESVEFLTRSHSCQPVTRIVWNNPPNQKRSQRDASIGNLLGDSVVTETLSGMDWPEHFFEVKVKGIGRHAAGEILNRETVSSYIGEVCPVPIAASFPYLSEVESIFAEFEEPLTLNVYVNEDASPVTKHYGDGIQFSNSRRDRFTDFEAVHINSIDGGISAIGWIAHSSYIGMIPSSERGRGIRARVGNIQIGDENLFAHLFPEERFNRWCVGEIHVYDPKIIPNGRRDYFELGPSLRNLENHMAAVLRNVARRCRKASQVRNAEKRFSIDLGRIADLYELAATGYLASEDSNALVFQALESVSAIRSRLDTRNSQYELYVEILEETEAKLNGFQADGDEIPKLIARASEKGIYQRVFKALVATTMSPRSTIDVIETVLRST